MTDHDHTPPMERVPTGIPGLDTVLNGGFLKGGVYIVQGTPGAGKTILANQTCFNHVESGGRAAYVTLLAESHTSMFQHMRPMAFFDETAIPDRLYFISAFNMLEEAGLRGLVDLLRREIRGHRASLLVLDGLVAAEESAGSAREFKKFVHEVQSHATANDCTVLLLTTRGTGAVSAEHTIVDGLIELDDQLFDVRAERSLYVRKFRGSGAFRGRHPFRISDRGLTVLPRIEAVFAAPSRCPPAEHARTTSGVDRLDALIGGGMVQATTCALVGPTGVGKTVFGLHFLQASSATEPGLLFGFFETPERLKTKASLLGIDLAGLEAAGAVEIVWQAQGENILDELGHRLLDAVRRRGVRRLLVDGLGGFIESAIHPERISRYLSVLSNELRALGVTTMYTLETRDVFGASVQVPVTGISSLVECMMMLRYVEVQARTRRLLSILKIRDSGFDPALHEFEITDRGVHYIGPFPAYETLLGGQAHQLPASVPDQSRPSKRPPRQE